VSFGKADAVSAGLGAPWLLTVPRGTPVQTTVALTAGLEAPVAKGAVIGKVVATAQGKQVGEAPLVAQAEVERSGWLMLAWQHAGKLIGK
jgi:D-alanyl-D-alanine carboxypeptidase (penicillin-binding protein 5/6)